MAHTERERKFLVPDLPPGLARHPHYVIRQGYLISGEDGSQVRLREIATGRRTQHFITIKRPMTADARSELEVPLTSKQFTQLWTLTKDQRLEKTRYKIPFGRGLTIEVDVYRGVLRGLAVAEVEFPTARASRSFRPPEWFGPDVTGREEFGNRSLARRGLPNRFKRGHRR